MQKLTLAQANHFLENELPGLMEKLRPEMQPLWGQMTPQHAVEHLAFFLWMPNGKLPVQCFTPEDRLPKYRQFLVWNNAMMPNFKNPMLDKEKLPDLRTPDLATAIAGFWQEWVDFKKVYEENPTATALHMVFGALNEEEWRTLHFKHCVHHLSQFGLTTAAAHGLVVPEIRRD